MLTTEPTILRMSKVKNPPGRPKKANRAKKPKEQRMKINENQAYCVKCKMAREMANVEITTSKNNKPLKKGNCSTCNTKMVKWLSTKTSNDN